MSSGCDDAGIGQFGFGECQCVCLVIYFNIDFIRRPKLLITFQPVKENVKKNDTVIVNG